GQMGRQLAGSAVFEGAGRTLTVNGGMETDFTNGLIRLLNQVSQTVCFTQGHLEANPDSLKQLDDNEDHGEDDNLVARIELHERHGMAMRSEEHTSELQSRENLVCRLLLEKKN